VLKGTNYERLHYTFLSSLGLIFPSQVLLNIWGKHSRLHSSNHVPLTSGCFEAIHWT